MTTQTQKRRGFDPGNRLGRPRIVAHTSHQPFIVYIAFTFAQVRCQAVAQDTSHRGFYVHIDSVDTCSDAIQCEIIRGDRLIQKCNSGEVELNPKIHGQRRPELIIEARDYYVRLTPEVARSCRFRLPKINDKLRYDLVNNVWIAEFDASETYRVARAGDHEAAAIRRLAVLLLEFPEFKLQLRCGVGRRQALNDYVRESGNENIWSAVRQAYALYSSKRTPSRRQIRRLVHIIG